MKNYKVKYQVLGTPWDSETLICSARDSKDAEDKAYREVADAYGSEILKDVKIISVTIKKPEYKNSAIQAQPTML